MSDFPSITTERLELRLPTRDDIAGMLAIVSDPETGRHLGPSTAPAEHFTRFQRNAGSWLLYGYGSFMVCLRESGELIGNCGIFHSFRGLGEDFDDSAEAGWILRSDCTGKGIASEAMNAVFGWFDAAHGPRRVVCMIAPENEPSLNLAERMGFAAMRDTVLPDGDAVRLLERLPAGN